MRVVALAVMAMAVGVARVSAGSADPAAADTALPGGGLTEHVIVVSIDGLRPDAIEAFNLRTLQRLMEGGSYSLEAQTILPSKTLPSHTSMLTGRVPDAHGITHNFHMDSDLVVGVPTIFELARARGYRTAAFYSKSKFRHLDREHSYDHREAPSSGMDSWMATRTVPAALQYLHHEKPNLLFIHIAEPDYAGHVGGWMGFLYKLAVRRADAAVAEIVEEAERTYGKGEFTILVTADHGGHDHDHGSDDPRDTTIPWIVYGEGVKPGPAPRGIRTMDTATTALWLLGVAGPGQAEGHAVVGAFETAPVLAGTPPAAPARAAASSVTTSVTTGSMARPAASSPAAAGATEAATKAPGRSGR